MVRCRRNESGHTFHKCRPTSSFRPTSSSPLDSEPYDPFLFSYGPRYYGPRYYGLRTSVSGTLPDPVSPSSVDKGTPSCPVSTLCKFLNPFFSTVVEGLGTRVVMSETLVRKYTPIRGTLYLRTSTTM